MSNPSQQPSETEKLLGVLGGGKTPTPEEFKSLVLALDNHRIIAKVFILEGTPFVFDRSPMKYVVFREQVADRFGIGSQDVAIVGSARLGFSPSPQKYGRKFSEDSDVDVVIVSEPLFHRGTHELFQELSRFGPPLHDIRRHLEKHGKQPTINFGEVKKTKEAIRNFVFQNFNP